MVQLSWSGNTTDKTGFDESRYHLADIKGLNNRGNGQGYIECRTTRWVILGPESAAVGFEDGTRYGQTDPHSILLRSNKSIKDSFLIGNPRSIVYHLNEHLILIRRGCSNDYVRRNLATFQRFRRI